MEISIYKFFFFSLIGVDVLALLVAVAIVLWLAVKAMLPRLKANVGDEKYRP